MFHLFIQTARSLFVLMLVGAGLACTSGCQSPTPPSSPSTAASTAPISVASGAPASGAPTVRPSGRSATAQADRVPGAKLPGLKPFARLPAPKEANVQVPPDEGVARYEAQIDKLHNKTSTAENYVKYLRGRMATARVDRFRTRTTAVEEMVKWIPTIDDETYKAKRREIALELRARVGILRALRVRAAGEAWPPAGTGPTGTPGVKPTGPPPRGPASGSPQGSASPAPAPPAAASAAPSPAAAASAAAAPAAASARPSASAASPSAKEK